MGVRGISGVVNLLKLDRDTDRFCQMHQYRGSWETKPIRPRCLVIFLRPDEVVWIRNRGNLPGREIFKIQWCPFVIALILISEDIVHIVDLKCPGFLSRDLFEQF